jgi:quercetin dioxygenase-like cupin family protein
MEQIDRRSALAFGLAGISGLVISEQAAAQTYGSSDGKEVGPGVRQVDLGERESLIRAYGKVRLRDIVLQPGAKTPDNMMMNDMLCHMTEGELAVMQNDKQFTVKKGDVWTCAKGITTEGTQNKGSTVAIMRIIDLIPA